MRSAIMERDVISSMVLPIPRITAGPYICFVVDCVMNAIHINEPAVTMVPKRKVG